MCNGAAVLTSAAAASAHNVAPQLANHLRRERRQTNSAPRESLPTEDLLAENTPCQSRHASPDISTTPTPRIALTTNFAPPDSLLRRSDASMPTTRRTARRFGRR